MVGENLTMMLFLRSVKDKPCPSKILPHIPHAQKVLYFFHNSYIVRKYCFIFFYFFFPFFSSYDPIESQTFPSDLNINLTFWPDRAAFIRCGGLRGLFGGGRGNVRQQTLEDIAENIRERKFKRIVVMAGGGYQAHPVESQTSCKERLIRAVVT